MTEIDDKKVVFANSSERIIHVHRVNIVANVTGEWTRPTILIAAEGQTPVFCTEVHVRGDVRIVERPPGVHMVVDDAAVLTALGTDGNTIELPSWAHPSKTSDAETQPIEVSPEVAAHTLGGAPEPRPLTESERAEVAGLYGGGPRKLEEFMRSQELFHLDPEGYASALQIEASKRQWHRSWPRPPIAGDLGEDVEHGSVEDAVAVADE